MNPSAFKNKMEATNVEIKKQKIHKRPFTVEEDRALMNYVMIYGNNNWVQIAMLMNGRTQKQCRERWTGHLCPSVNKGPWTLEEDIILAQKHSEIGNKWAKIAQFLPGRTDILVKNRWNTSVKNRVMNGELTLQPFSAAQIQQQPQPRPKTIKLPSVLVAGEYNDIEKWLAFMSARHNCFTTQPQMLLVNSPNP